MEVNEKLGPFDFIDDVSEKKVGIMNRDNEKIYNPFLTNRAFSYHVDTIMLSSEINLYPDLPKKLQHDYYMEGARKKRRRSKWFKSESSADINSIMKFYRFSRQKASAALDCLSSEQMEIIRRATEVTKE